MTKKLKEILDYFRWAGWTVEVAHLISEQTGRTHYHCSTPGDEPYTFNIGEMENLAGGPPQVNVILPRRATYGGEVAALLGIITALGVEIQHARAPVNLEKR